MTSDQIEQLIDSVADGDKRAFDTLYRATSAKLHAICVSVLRDRPAAEETLQEVYLRIWKRAGSYKSNGLSPMTWLITIARNASIDRLRQRKSRPQAEGSDLLDTHPSSDRGPEESAILQAEWQQLSRCMEQLGDQQADAVRSVYLSGISYADLAERAQLPINTVRSWLRRSLTRLKECVAQ